MATLLLTAVGSAIAGPIGAAIGAMAGQRIDQALLGPKGRQGARLADLAVQSSTYGASIGHLFGRMRVSGTVIWATDLREESRKVSQGKGGPKATVYSYSASFAVLLSARRIARIGRIWADGKLLRGEAGDFKVETGFCVHDGTSDQPVDPLIASAEGAGAPAYRGRAYVVFEDMALESFGNRIPVLSFEVIADEAPVPAGAIISALAAPEVAASGGVLLDGYVADGASVAAAIAPLDNALFLEWVDGGATVRVGEATPPPPPLAVPDADLGATAGHAPLPRLELSRAAAASLPSRIALGFADPQRDYQPGTQALDLHLDGAELHIDLPATLAPEAAAALARDRLLSARQASAAAEVRLPWRYLDAWAVASLIVEGSSWRVRAVRLDAMCLVFTLSPRGASPDAVLPVDGGRALSEPDLEIGATTLVLADLPPVDDMGATAPVIVAAAAGAKPGWRSAALMQRTDPAGAWADIGRSALPATFGTSVGALALASPHLLDLHNSVTVRLLRDDMTLLNVDDDALSAGANLAMLGEEAIQFGRVLRVGPGLWELSRLLRGRRGTEARMAQHMAGETFLLLERDALLPLSVAAGTNMVEIMAKGVGDVAGVIASHPLSAPALRPLSPVHLRAKPTPDGGLDIGWVRRSREGWRWLDMVDAPLGEETELYRIDMAGAPATPGLSTTSAQPQITIPPAQISAFRDAGATALLVSISQIGRFAASTPATRTFPL